MTEVLTRFPDLTETETQFEQFDQIKTEELLFPKLDSILLPIVMENAEVIAPCQWMGGAEVSLSVALNNYYRPMTEENADEVIAEVYGFLVEQYTPETVIDQESEYVIKPTLTIAPQEESAVYDRHAHTIDETRIHIQPIHAELAEDVVAPTKRSIDTQEAPTDKTTHPASGYHDIAFESRVDDAPETPQLLENDEEKEPTVEMPRPAPAQDGDTASVFPALMKPHVLEVDREHVINHAPLTGPSIEVKEIFSADISSTPISLRPTNQEIERIDALRDELSRENPLAYAESSAESQNTQDEDIRVDDGCIEHERTSAGKHLDEPDSLSTEKATLEIAREAASTTSDTDKTITEAAPLLSSVHQPAEVAETNKAEAAKEFAEIIADMSASLELDDDSTNVAASKEAVQEELATLYTELLDGPPFAHRDEFIHLLVALTTESQGPKESDVQAPVAAIRTKIKSLKVVINDLRQTGNRMVAIGRLALRLRTMAGAINPTVGFYAHEVRDGARD